MLRRRHNIAYRKLVGYTAVINLCVYINILNITTSQADAMCNSNRTAAALLKATSIRTLRTI